jgi:dipeptidyl aminopeptidase/acylaminoacyl peptidase
MREQWGVLLTAVWLLLLSGCGLNQGAQQTPDAAAVVVHVMPDAVPETVTETAVPSPTTTATNTPTPTFTPTPSATPTATITPSPTATPTPTHPLMIELMREQAYPGSEIVFEETLKPGDNYDRYVISYRSEGNKIYALFTVPWGEAPGDGWPAILFNHGWIDPDEYRTTERYIDYEDAIARNGYIVLRSDYRGHGDSEGIAHNAYISPGYTADVLNALASVKKYEDADPERIGMWGHSMGGFITLRAMVVSDEIKAGAIWGGVVVKYEDLFSRWRRDPDNDQTPTPNPTREERRRRQWFGAYGTPQENPGFWSAMSSNSYLKDLSGPIQLHHGTADSTVPHEFSQILAAEMEAAGQPVELCLYEGDNHNLAISFWTAMNRTLEFFDEHVKNG